jgi:hypothetical protein
MGLLSLEIINVINSKYNRTDFVAAKKNPEKNILTIFKFSPMRSYTNKQNSAFPQKFMHE